MELNSYVSFGIAWCLSTAIGVLLYRYFCKEKRVLSYDIGASIIGAGTGVFAGILLAAAYRLNDSFSSLAAMAIVCGTVCSIAIQRSFGSWIDPAD